MESDRRSLDLPLPPFKGSVLVLWSVSTPDLVRLEAQLTARPDTPVLLDWRQWSTVRRTAAIDVLLSILGSLPRPACGDWAMVIGPARVDYGISRMFAARAELLGVRSSTFSTVDTALDWLRGPGSRFAGAGSPSGGSVAPPTDDQLPISVAI